MARACGGEGAERQRSGGGGGVAPRTGLCSERGEGRGEKREETIGAVVDPGPVADEAVVFLLMFLVFWSWPSMILVWC